MSESEDEVAPIAVPAKKSNESERNEADSKTTTTKVAQPTKGKLTRAINTTAESLYEDAVSEPTKNQCEDAVDNVKISASQQCDATFVTTTDEQAEQLSPRGTYIIPATAAATVTDATFMMPQEVNNRTVVVEATTKPAKQVKVAQSSLLTDDESDAESTSSSQNTKKKELFK